jgi:hypothetical protein
MSPAPELAYLAACLHATLQVDATVKLGGRRFDGARLKRGWRGHGLSHP